MSDDSRLNQSQRISAAKQAALERMRADMEADTIEEDVSAALNEEERRDSPRIPLVEDIVVGSNQHDLYTGFTENISSGGIFVATFETAEVGQRFSLSFQLPGLDRKIEVEGEVTWLREYQDDNKDLMPGMGLKFVQIAEEDLKLLHRHLKKHDSMFYPDAD